MQADMPQVIPSSGEVCSLSSIVLSFLPPH